MRRRIQIPARKALPENVHVGARYVATYIPPPNGLASRPIHMELYDEPKVFYTRNFLLPRRMMALPKAYIRLNRDGKTVRAQLSKV